MVCRPRLSLVYQFSVAALLNEFIRESSRTKAKPGNCVYSRSFESTSVELKPAVLFLSILRGLGV